MENRYSSAQLNPTEAISQNNYGMLSSGSSSSNIASRKRSQVVQFEPSPKKLRSYRECEGCRNDECGKCGKVKPKYGGPNKKRKGCIHRTCTNKENDEPNSSMRIKSILVNAKKVIRKSPGRMVCIHCGRDRALSLARTDQFCSHRCITNFQKSNTMVTKATSHKPPKSVKFNLKPTVIESSYSSRTVSSDVTSLITSLLQLHKSCPQPATFELPSNLPADIRQWTVAHVVQYFKTTADCHGYSELFQAQEVDGIALLLLSHETLVKCLDIELEHALKIMLRVEELKHIQNYKSTSQN